MTRSTFRWKELPGSFDTVNTRWLFPSDNPLDIPVLRPNPELNPPQHLIPYRARVRDKALLATGGLHFWLDDYRFESVWSRPFQTLTGLTNYGAVLTPDFSLYRDQPLAVQIWQTYRTRWLGAFWQAHSLPVIPTVSWSSPPSFEFCFAGLPLNSMIAIAATDYRDKAAARFFNLGFEAMLRLVQPRLVLCYGPLPPELAGTVETLIYPTRWEQMRHAIRQTRAALKQNVEYGKVEANQA